MEQTDAEATQYGRITIRVQPREAGGFALQFIDAPTGQTLATHYTAEEDADKAKAEAVARAQQMLAEGPFPE